MKVLGIVTGASRGFGKSICEEFVKANPNKEQAIDLVLFARSLDGLTKTKESVESISKVAKVIDSISLEMSNIPDVESKFKTVLDNIKWNEYSKICFFNNHGTLYNLDRVEDFTDYQVIQKDNDTNTTSFVVTTSLLLKKLKSLGQDYKADVTFIHSSSLAAIKPFESWSLYCASRAFRDQFFKVVALENKSIRVLNYSLGALDTDMGQQVRETCSHEATREYYVSLKTEGKVIHPNTSAAVCSKLVYNNQFESGDHVDFYDEVKK